MRFLVLSLIIVTSLYLAESGLAQMNSANFEIRWDTLGIGGSDTASSASYQMRDTVGNTGIGGSSSTSYDLRAGYRQGIFDQVLSFDLSVQSTNGVNATVLVGTTVTVSNTAGMSVGDTVAVIEDVGVGQSAGIGKILNITGNDLTLDEIETGGAPLVIDGTNDQVYRMSLSSIDFGTVNSTTLYQRLLGWEVTIDVSNGYSVFVIENQDLTSGADTIADVADGSVNAGSEEYGAISSDATLAGSTFDTQDTAFTGAFQEVDTEATTSFASKDFLTVKAAIAAGTDAGDYSHTLSLIASGNF
ncbi:MAG: hypothetical protein ABIG32_01625 [Candidatus Uhrbacteria bacterium]|nr:hypothetical protein [Patescibacteria group bacterium]MBU1907187.1 hypothetical protein [Patescibacteria group bacterium]